MEDHKQYTTRLTAHYEANTAVPFETDRQSSHQLSGSRRPESPHVKPLPHRPSTDARQNTTNRSLLASSGPLKPSIADEAIKPKEQSPPAPSHSPAIAPKGHLPSPPRASTSHRRHRPPLPGAEPCSHGRNPEHHPTPPLRNFRQRGAGAVQLRTKPRGERHATFRCPAPDHQV